MKLIWGLQTWTMAESLGQMFKIEVFNALLNTDLALQTIPLSKQPFKTQPQLESEDVTWSPQYNLSTTRTNKRRALSLQTVELDGWFSNSSHCTRKHVPHNSCTSWIRVLYFISIFLDRRLRFEPTFQLKGWNLKTLQKWNSYEAFNLEQWPRVPGKCSRLKSSMPFKRDLALQNIPLSKQPFKTQPQI